MAVSRFQRTEAAAQDICLAADIGGTYARVGRLSVSHVPQRSVDLLDYTRYVCADWPSLEALLADFMARTDGGAGITRGVLASTGYVRDGELVAENLCWPVRVDALSQALGLERLRVVNDFEALAHAIPYLPDDATSALIDRPSAAGPVLIMGPGTGLGCAVLLQDAEGIRVLPSEAGHIALAPGNRREMQLLQIMMQGREHVHTGYALSGPGLLNLYRAIAELDAVPAIHRRPEDISRAALDRHAVDAVAAETLSVFCAWLGSVAGDLAVLFRASGGVFLAGGVLSHFKDALRQSAFSQRFVNKGVMRDFLEAVPVRLMEHGRLGVMGAAVSHSAHQRRE